MSTALGTVGAMANTCIGMVGMTDEQREEYLKQTIAYDKNEGVTTDTLFQVGIIGVMNPEIFNCFDEIFILTYLFADSNYDCYCRFCRIPYAYYHIADNTLCEGKFDDTAFREQCKSLIRLYSGRLNFRPPVERNQRAVTLSKSFYQNASTQMLSRVKCNASNFIRNICNYLFNKSNYITYLWCK